MKRFEIIGEPTFDLIEFKEGSIILYDEFEDFILRRIKELEAEILILNKSGMSMSNSQKLNRVRGIKKELKSLLT